MTKHPLRAKSRGQSIPLIALAVWLAPKPAPAAAAGAPVPTLAQVSAIAQQRCVLCHNAQVQQKNVALHTPELIRLHAQQVYQQAVVLKLMPMNNATQITDAERALFGELSWKTTEKLTLSAGARLFAYQDDSSTQVEDYAFDLVTGTIKELMHGIIDPSADAIWESVSIDVTASGGKQSRMRRPRNCSGGTKSSSGFPARKS